MTARKQLFLPHGQMGMADNSLLLGDGRLQ
jgi:hypothetical protein